MARSSEQTELMPPQLLEASEQKGSTEEDVNVNLRRSFSWDRSFFTSEGVLDAEELSSMIDGGGKDGKHQLHGIEQKLCRSMDSISTLESDLALESLEAKLLQEIEASTKKSRGASNLTNSSIKVSSGERDSQSKASSCASKEKDLASEKRPAMRTEDSISLTPQSPNINREVNSTSTIKSKRDHVGQKGTQAATTQASKVTGAVGPGRAVPTTSLSSLGSSTPIKTEPTRPSPLCGSSGSSSGNNVKSSATLARKSTSSKTTADSTSKTPPGISTKNKVLPVKSRLPSHLVSSNLSSSTSPASSISQWLSGSSSSTSAVNQRSSRGSNVPHRSLVNNEKSSATNARRKNDQKIDKPTAGVIPKTPSSINLKNKPPPVTSSPSVSFTSSISQRPSESSWSTCTVDQRSISRGSRGTSVHQRSLDCDASAKSTLKNHPTGRTPVQNGKQPAALRPQTGTLSRPPVQSMGCKMPLPNIGFIDVGKSYKSCLLTGLPKTGATQPSKTGSSNGARARKLPPPKTVAAHTGLKPNSSKTPPKPSQKQSSAKAKPSSSTSRGVKNLLVISPEVLDIKGKLNALKMEISMQKGEKCKEIKMAPAESGIGASSSNIWMTSSHHVGMRQMNNQAKST